MKEFSAGFPEGIVEVKFICFVRTFCIPFNMNFLINIVSIVEQLKCYIHFDERDSVSYCMLLLVILYHIDYVVQCCLVIILAVLAPKTHID